MNNYIKRWWLEKELNDGNIFKGWVCTFAEKSDDFPQMLKGTFHVYKNENEEGFHGSFRLDGQSENEIKEKNQYVLMLGIYPKPKTIDSSCLTRKEAEIIIRNLQPINYKEFNFCGRLEDNIVLKSTYVEKI